VVGLFLYLRKLYTLYMTDIEEGLKIMQTTGKIDRIKFNTPGMLIDLYNERLVKKQEKDFKGLTNDMNEYYWKLLIDTITQRESGIENPIYKSRSVSLTTPSGSLIVPGGNSLIT